MLKEQAALAETEEEIPFALRNRPVLDQFQQWYWNAYQEIAGSRNYTSAGAAEIPYSEKIKWLNENDVDDPDDRKDYIFMISAIDGAYLDYHYSKNKAA